MLVGADAGGQNLRDGGIGDGGEAVGDGARRGGVLLLGHFAQRHHEGERAVLVVFQVADVITWLHAAEAQRHAVGETERVDGRGDLLAEGDQARFPTEFDPRLGQLLGEGHAVRVAGHEHVQVLLL